MKRRTFIAGMGASVSLAPGFAFAPAREETAAHPALTKINPKFMASPKEVHDWHVVKDSKGGPTMTGSPSWKNYVEFAEKSWRDAGVTDIFRNSFTFTRWYTTEYPDDSNWSLHVDGKKIKVASYGCNSGKTPEQWSNRRASRLQGRHAG